MKFTPEVMTTDWNLSNTGLMAIDASRQLKCIIGLDIVGVRSSNGSIIRTNPANISSHCRSIHNIQLLQSLFKWLSFLGMTPGFPVIKCYLLPPRQRLCSASSSSLIIGCTQLSTIEDRAFPAAVARIWNIYPSTSLLHLGCLSSGHNSELISSPFPIPCTLYNARAVMV